jgi:bifunctional polynucleotide phosphatase/kinase
MPPTIYNINEATFRCKMAGFDYDWTMVNPKDGKTFPRTVDDWQWMYPNIPEQMIKYHTDGYMIVIFTNQSKQWKHDQIQIVAKSLNIPLFIVIATDKIDYKPNRTLFTTLCGDLESLVNLKKSFYVGDALGRTSDFSDSDRVFAENIGISCHSPESLFCDPCPLYKVPDIILSVQPEIIIMVGFPGSGKSTIAENICKSEQYVHISGDVHKTTAKMKKASLEYIKQKKSIVFDATNSSIKKRSEYIVLGREYGYSIRCIHVATDLNTAYLQNKKREDKKQVPRIAYSVYNKHFVPPHESEGFTLCNI